MLVVLLCLEIGLNAPSLPLRRGRLKGRSAEIGDDDIELAEEVLPNSLCVDS